MFIAATEDGRWVGMAGSAPLDIVPGHTHIFGVYMAPAHRGRPAGLAARLMDAGIRWARDNTDASWLTLGVHEDNKRAQAFYRRTGFTETGKIVPYALDPSKKLYIISHETFARPLPGDVRSRRWCGEHGSEQLAQLLRLSRRKPADERRLCLAPCGVDGRQCITASFSEEHRTHPCVVDCRPPLHEPARLEATQGHSHGRLLHPQPVGKLSLGHAIGPRELKEQQVLPHVQPDASEPVRDDETVQLRRPHQQQPGHLRDLGRLHAEKLSRLRIECQPDHDTLPIPQANERHRP